MEATASAYPGTLFGSALPKEGHRSHLRARFGDVVVLTFLVAQFLDGVFTYVGVRSFGIGIEANPIVAMLMVHFGNGVGLAGAKIVAGALGIGLHLRQIHAAVAILTGFYLAVAVGPWVFVLFF